MIVTKKAMPRRTVLRGLGATIGLPLLGSMVPALTALAQTAARPVRRFTTVYVGNGAAVGYFTPELEGAGYALTPILGSIRVSQRYFGAFRCFSWVI